MTVTTMSLTMTEQEYTDWVKYYTLQPINIPEVQMSLLLTMVSNVFGGKTKMTDFILSYVKPKKAKEPEQKVDLDKLIQFMFGGPDGTSNN